MKHNVRWLVLLAAIGALALACDRGPDGEPLPTDTVVPTSGPTESATPLPSPTPAPTCTPAPEPAATPTVTPVLTPELIAPLPPPGSGERWIDIDVSDQTASAMVADSPWYTALVTTGKPETPTPKGEFRIIKRVYDETMAGSGYYVDHVLFTQYFTTNYHAIHYNYWADANAFGREPTSHGCVGMRYRDAEYFWYFAGVGTRVVVHD
jgi:lipoprotein-anchoring transpeptidase ErfK/SrfK